MKSYIINLVVAALLVLPVAAKGKPATLKEWKFGEGTLSLLTLPWNHDSQLGLWWQGPGGGEMSSYGGIEDLAKLIRVLEKIKDRPPIGGGELKIHWVNDVLVTFKEKEVVFKFGSQISFTASWNDTMSIAKAIEEGRKKLNEDAGEQPLQDTKSKNPEQAAPSNGDKQLD